jgi:hypothetical protein
MNLMNNKVNIEAVHDYDLEKTLKSLGLLSKIYNNKIKCKFCKRKINMQNIFAIFPESGSIKIVCLNISCVKKLLDLIREDKIKI